MSEKFNPLLIDDDDNSLAESDSVIRSAIHKRKAAIWEMTRELANVTYAGTESRQEQAELEANLLSLINAKKHSYKYIEQLLVSLGYNLNKIKHAFRKLTGISSDEFLNYDAYMTTPPSIPGFNHGWGESKDSEFNFYFVMPYKHGYSVFGQKGDLIREDVKYVSSLDEALEVLSKKVKEVYTYDKIVDIKVPKKPIPENDDTYMKTNVDYVGDRTAALEKHIVSIKGHAQPREIRAVLENALNENLIDVNEFQSLLGRYVGVRSAEDSTFESGLMEQPVKKELSEVTPQQFFDNETDDGVNIEANLGDRINAVTGDIIRRNSELINYAMSVKSFKYLNMNTKTAQLDSTPSVGVQRAEDTFNATGAVSVVFYITCSDLPESKNTKPGLILYSFEDGRIHTSDSFKGKDDKFYLLSEDGFNQYFEPEHESEEK